MRSAILALEVSQRDGGVAVRCHDGSVLVERLTSSTRRGDALMPAVEAICREGKIAPRDLEGIGVTIGPGGFTGLRIGIAAAKMLSWSLDIPLVAIPTALLAAESATDLDGLLAVALSSKDETCWLTMVEGEIGCRSIAQAGFLVDGPAFLTRIQHAKHVLADDHLPASMTIHGLQTHHPDFDPAILLEMTERRLQAGECLDPLVLQPIYPREPEAVRLWDSRTGK